MKIPLIRFVINFRYSITITNYSYKTNGDRKVENLILAACGVRATYGIGCE